MYFSLSILCLFLQHFVGKSAPLDDYVNNIDENYGWVYLGAETNLHGRSIKGDHTWTGYILNVTSQR